VAHLRRQAVLLGLWKAGRRSVDPQRKIISQLERPEFRVIAHFRPFLLASWV
jgi:hypothetical protein